MSVVMTVATEVEKYFADMANDQSPSWLRALQEKQMQSFVKRGFPTKREELWKYTDVSYLSKQKFEQGMMSAHQYTDTLATQNHVVFVNGHFSAEHTNLKNLPEGVVACSIRDALSQHAELIKPYLSKEFDSQRFPFVALNTALLNDGMFLYIPKNCAISAPIHCVYLNTNQNNFMTHSRNIIVADVNSQCVFIEEHIAQQAANYFANVVTQLYLNENALVHYYKIQAEDLQATHIANVIAEQKKDSTLKSFTLDVGGLLTRTDINIALQERGAACELNGLYYLDANGQHVDNHLFVDHIAEHGTSSMLYKGILDKKSRAVFNGKVFVEKSAQKINAHQANHNLLLSKDAEIDTKPELEIYADDVKCAHGATIGQLDAEALFYLRSRGMTEAEARIMLTHAFAEEITSKIEHPLIMQYIQERAGQHEKF